MPVLSFQFAQILVSIIPVNVSMDIILKGICVCLIVMKINAKIARVPKDLHVKIYAMDLNVFAMSLLNIITENAAITISVPRRVHARPTLHAKISV